MQGIDDAVILNTRCLRIKIVRKIIKKSTYTQLHTISRYGIYSQANKETKQSTCYDFSTSVWPIDSFNGIELSLLLSDPSLASATKAEDSTVSLFCLILSSDLSNTGEFIGFDVKEFASSDEGLKALQTYRQ